MRAESFFIDGRSRPRGASGRSFPAGRWAGFGALAPANSILQRPRQRPSVTYLKVKSVAPRTVNGVRDFYHFWIKIRWITYHPFLPRLLLSDRNISLANQPAQD